MTNSFDHKQTKLRKIFQACPTDEARYEKIIELGNMLAPYPEGLKTADKRVSGCQSEMFLNTTQNGDGTLQFEAYSDALISRGLAALLLTLYNGETAETLLKCPPSILEELAIPTLLSPGRSNGLSSLHLKMQGDALRTLLPSK